MNFDRAAAELRQQEIARLSEAIVPRIEAMRRMTPETTTPYTELERTGGQWPYDITVPLWPAQIERLALAHWLDELTIKSGKRIRIDFAPPLSGCEMRGAIASLH